LIKLDGNSFDSLAIRDALNERYNVALHLAIFDSEEAPDQRVIFSK
jgi:hypothetical protein